MAEVHPHDDVAGRTFRSVFRGYDPGEVAAFLSEIARRLTDAEEQRDRLVARLSEVGGRDLKTEMEAVSRDVGAVLEAAREAAEAMRERATADATRWRSEAVAEAEAELRRARTDAEALRSDAWTTAGQMLEQSRVEAERMRERASQDALRILGEAEREAHRMTTGARREAEEATRAARMEVERLTIEAQREHDVLVERARKTSEAAQERTRALEQRRDELMAEIEGVRASLTKVEIELEERREGIGLSTVGGSVKVVRPAQYADIGEEGWDLGETVRVIPAATTGPESEPAAPVSGEPFTGEGEEPSSTVRVVRAPASRPAPEQEPPTAPTAAVAPEAPVEELEPETPPEPAPADEPEPPLAPAPGEEPEPEPPREPAPAEEPEPPEVVAPGVEAPLPPRPSVSDVDLLFASLREPAPEAAGPAPVEELPDEAAEPVPDPDALLEDLGVPRLTADAAFALREETLLPVANRALRGLKRQLTDVQNEALEEVRLHGADWMPDVEDLRRRLRPDLVVLVTEGFGAGHEAAERMLGRQVARPAAPKRDETEDAARDLTAALVHAVEEGAAAGHGPRELGSGVSRVFRAWRTDEAERRVRDLGVHAYHEGVQATVVAAGGPPLRWVVSGRGCASCRAAAERPVESTVPPLHPGCACLIVAP
jgi:DivIVA domain-containing protein